MKKQAKVTVRVCVYWIFVLACPLFSQEPETTAPNTTDPLATKEVMVRDRFRRFEDRVFRLREQLEEVEPDNAKRLARVLERAGELQLGERLDQLVKLMDKRGAHGDAIDAQGKWLADAERVLGILLERDSENQERKDEIQRLEEYKEKLDRLLQDQQDLRDASAQAALSQRMAEQLDQAMKRVDALLEAQRELSDAPAAPGSPKGNAGKQTALGRDVDDLAEDLKRMADSAPDESADTPAMKAAREKTGDAAKSASSSGQSMSQAGGAMQAGDSGKQQQQEAIKKLEETKQRLEEARKALDADLDIDKLSQSQGELGDKAKSLAQQMSGKPSGGESSDQSGQPSEGSQGSQGEQGSKSEQGSQGQKGSQGQEGSQGEQGSEGQQGESQSQQGQQDSPGGQDDPVPGSEQVEKAQGSMEQAESDLAQDEPEEAVPDQDEAIEQLQQAQRELENALNQLRQEEREETLRDLEARFREMLAKQKAINDGTVALHEIGRDKFGRAEELETADLSAKERILSADAATCLNILEEDGTTVVVPHIMEQLSEDMGTVADRLGSLKVGDLTQQIEREIVETLSQLVEAVKQMQQENEQQSNQSAQQKQKDELLPKSAEYKLLRASQLRVNTRTQAIEHAKVEGAEKKDALHRTLAKSADRQKELSAVANEMREREEQQ